MNEKFRKDYFIGGYESNYIDYRTKKFSCQADDIIKILNLKKEDKLLDFGCATGALLFELKKKGFKNIKGTDISNWAIEYGKEIYNMDNELEFYNRNLLNESFDYIIMLDVLEHFISHELETVFKLMKKTPNSGLGLLVRIPVSANEGEDFKLDISKNDKTHIQVHSKIWWINLIVGYGFKFIKYINENNIYDSDGVFCGYFTIGKYE